MNEKLIPASVFLIYGLIAGLKPEWIVKMQVWSNKKILDAKFIPSKKTLQIYRGMGVVFIVVAVLMLFW